MKNLKDYRIILTIWIALGIGITGYFNIYPDVIKTKIKNPKLNEGAYKSIPKYVTKMVTSYEKYKLSLLVTSVGAILIGGIGFFTSKEKYHKF